MTKHANPTPFHPGSRHPGRIEWRPTGRFDLQRSASAAKYERAGNDMMPAPERSWKQEEQRRTWARSRLLTARLESPAAVTLRGAGPDPDIYEA